METKYKYNEPTTIDINVRREANKYARRICMNANGKVLPYMIETGMKIEGNTTQIVKAAFKKEALFNLVVAVEKYQKNLPEIADPDLAAEIYKKKRAKFEDLLIQICNRNNDDSEFSEIYDYRPDLEQFFEVKITKNAIGEEESATLECDYNSMIDYLTPELTDRQRMIFEKKCQICDLLNDLFVFNTPNNKSSYDVREWADFFVCEYNESGKPYFQPSDRLDDLVVNL